MGTTTLENSEYLALIRKVEEAERATADKQRELEAARADAAKAAGEVNTAWQAAQVVIDFAVANLDPENIRDWPHRELAVCANIAAIYGGNGTRDSERAMAWNEHVRRAQKWELERQLRDNRTTVSMPPIVSPDGGV